MIIIILKNIDLPRNKNSVKDFMMYSFSFYKLVYGYDNNNYCVS